MYKYSRKNNVEKAKKFVEKHPTLLIDQLGREGKTALIHAAEHGAGEMVDFLLLKGANPNARSQGGETALMYVPGTKWKKGASDKISVANSLLAAGANPDLARKKEGNTALIYAEANTNVKLVDLFLCHKANPNIQNAHGNTAAFVAISYSKKDIKTGVLRFSILHTSLKYILTFSVLMLSSP